MFSITSYGVQITSMEDVFLKVGEDHTVTPKAAVMPGIGGDRQYHSNFAAQVIGIASRKWNIALNDIVTIPLLGLPSVIFIVAAALYAHKVISGVDWVNDLVTILMYMGAYLAVPGLIAEFIVREREDKLRTVLTVMGCDFRAYWIGTFIADFVMMSVPMIVMWITWGVGGLTDFSENLSGMSFLVTIVFNIQLIAFSYISTWMFTSPKSCIAFMPMFIILLLLTPLILLDLIYLIFSQGLHIWTPSANFFLGVLLWGVMMTSPHGALLSALLNTTVDLHSALPDFPPVRESFLLVPVFVLSP